METRITNTARPLKVSSEWTRLDRWVHALARLGIRRRHWRVEPGLYVVGSPSPESPVLVTANYRLSFDALRRELTGIDAFILVLNTFGINVWCAAGKGTFGTDELVQRIESTGLKEIVGHRRLTLPQLGASGVSAHEVRKRSGFYVDYGPVRAADLPFYLRTGAAEPGMRRVRFNLIDRLILVPVELIHLFVPTLVMGVAAWFLGGWIAAGALAAAVTAGAVVFPILLPWIPARDFSSKGYILGGLTVMPFGIALFVSPGAESAPFLLKIAASLGLLLSLSTVTAFLALNFTGSTTFTSKSAVRREMKIHIPAMALMLGCGLILLLVWRVL